MSHNSRVAVHVDCRSTHTLVVCRQWRYRYDMDILIFIVLGLLSFSSQTKQHHKRSLSPDCHMGWNIIAVLYLVYTSWALPNRTLIPHQPDSPSSSSSPGLGVGAVGLGHFRGSEVRRPVLQRDPTHRHGNNSPWDTAPVSSSSLRGWGGG